MDKTIAPEDTRPRQIVVWGLLAAILATLTLFTLVTRDSEHREKVMREIQACRMDAVRGGASLHDAELLCGKV